METHSQIALFTRLQQVRIRAARTQAVVIGEAAQREAPVKRRLEKTQVEHRSFLNRDVEMLDIDPNGVTHPSACLAW
jgi:hypothetical protein